MTPSQETPADAPQGGVTLLYQAVKEKGWGAVHPPYEPPQPIPAEQRDERFMARAAKWCQASLDGLTSELAAMPPDSGRNIALNNAALKLFRFVLAGHLDGTVVSDALRDAALECGLPNGEIEATMGSAGRGAHKYGPADPPIEGSTLPTGDEPFGEPALDIEVDLVTGQIIPTDAERLSALVRAKLPLLNWRELWDDTSEEEWIIEPLLPARRLIALYSPPKVGKSLLCLECACAIATGRDVLGVSIDRPRRVLYVDFENDPKADIRERLQAMGYGPDDLENLCYLSFPTIAAFDSPRGGQELMAAVHEYQCEVVVVDTVSRAVAGEENENDTWLNFYRHTGLLLKQAGVALIRLDHSGKDETKGQRGGSAKSGDVDAVWRLSRLTDDSYRLDCEAARFPIAEKVLVLHREVAPLRHRVDAMGRSAAVEIQVNHALAMLEQYGVPVELGRDKARAELKKHGVKVSNVGLSGAIKRRQNLSANAADRSEDDHGF